MVYDFKKGLHGQNVRKLQEDLTKVGFIIRPVDGDFGPKTEKSLIDFQKSKNLNADGIAGPITLSALEKANNNSNISLSIKTLRIKSTGILVRRLQERLTKAGYEVSPQTEFFGTKTDIAVRNFQRKNKMLADGIVGPNTWKKLGVIDSNNLSATPTSSFSSLVASLGSFGSFLADLSSTLPRILDGAKPVSQLKTSQKGLEFLYTREAWAGVSNHLHWSGGSSGVTLGPGYDMKGRSGAEISQDMIKIGLNADIANKIAKAAGLRGVAAKKFCQDNKKLVYLKNNLEFTLMKLVVPRYESQVRKKIHVNLLQHEFDTLVSFAYNLGEVWTSIATHINSGNITAAMTRMKAANKSGGSVNEGLTKRRALEISLYLFGNYGKLRSVS